MAQSRAQLLNCIDAIEKDIIHGPAACRALIQIGCMKEAVTIVLGMKDAVKRLSDLIIDYECRSD